jgi:hypothetical protein
MTVKDYFKKRNLDPVGYFREHSHGMFLWVTTIIEYLNAMDGEDELTEILSKPPSTITEVYHIVLVGLQRDYFPHELSWIKEIILWTVMAKRDMTMSEIEVAIRISREKYDRNQNTNSIEIERKLRNCGAILQIVKGNSPFESTVSILHDTFKQFIMSKDEKSVAAGGAREFFITPNEAEQKLAVACISYLSPIIIEYEASFHFFYKVAPFLPIEYPLFSYSTLYWSEHLSVINTGELSGAIQERLSTSLLRFLTHRNLYNWISSVMAFTARVTNSPLYNPLALSITSSLERASDWVTEEGYICTSSAGACIGVPSHFEDTKRVEDLQAVDTWRRRCAAAAAEAWLRSHPLWWESGIGCFKITSALYVHSRTDFALTNKAEMISLLEGLVEDSGHLTEF